jgi:hypothetical protein
MSEYREPHRGLPDLGHRFPVDARCECGVAMSFLIREGAAVAARAAELLRADIRIDVTQHADPSLDQLHQLGPYMAALNLALLRYSAGWHKEGNVGIALGELEGPPDDAKREAEARWLVQAMTCETCERWPDRDGPCYRCAVNAVKAALGQVGK